MSATAKRTDRSFLTGGGGARPTCVQRSWEQGVTLVVYSFGLAPRGRQAKSSDGSPGRFVSSIDRRTSLSNPALSVLWNPLWLTIDKVIHHDDVVLFIIIGPRNITSSDTHTSDPRVTVGDTEERKSRIAG